MHAHNQESPEDNRIDSHEDQDRDRPQDIFEEGEEEQVAESEKELEIRKRIRTAERFVRKGEIKKAIGALTRDGLCPLTEEVREKLVHLHPTEAHQLPKLPSAAPRVKVKVPLLRRIIQKVANGSAPSPSGFIGELFGPITQEKAAVEGMKVALEMILNGEVTENTRQMLLQCRLVAIQKKGNPNDPRPITVSEVIYKIAALYALELVKDHLPPIFKDLQFGQGAAGGAALAIHKLQAAMQLMGDNAAALMLDQENAYNSCSRADMVRSVYSNPSLSSIFRFVDFAYGGAPTNLLVASKGQVIQAILSSSGARQGDPLGSFLFCVFFQPHIDSLLQAARDPAELAENGVWEEEHRAADRCARIIALGSCPLAKAAAAAVVDDLTIVSNWKSVLKAYDAARNNPLLHVNAAKSVIILSAQDARNAECVRECNARGLKIKEGAAPTLGGAIGLADAVVQKVIEEEVAKQDPVFEACLHPNMSPQTAFQILKASLIFKMSYLAQTIPPRLLQDTAKLYDQRILDCYLRSHGLKGEILKVSEKGSSRYEEQLARITLPLSLGGLGLTAISDKIHIIYFRAAAQAASTVAKLATEWKSEEAAVERMVKEREGVLQVLCAQGFKTTNSIRDEEGEVKQDAILPNASNARYLDTFYGGTILTKECRIQTVLSGQADAKKLNRIIKKADDATKASWRARQGGNASEWLRIVKGCSVAINPLEWEMAHRRLHSLPPDLRLHFCKCGYNFQDEGSIHTHFHSCLKYKRTSVTRRHDELCRYITTKCQQLGFIASCTVKRSDPDDPVKSKIPDGSQTSLNGNTTFTDVTFRNTDSYILQARSNPGSVLDTAEASKHKKYKSYCNTLDATFAALACSVSGMIGAEFQEFLFYMANHALSSPIVQHIQNKIERANLLKRLKHEIAIINQKGNAHVDLVGVAEAQALGLLDSYLERNTTHNNPLAKLRTRDNALLYAKNLSRKGVFVPKKAKRQKKHTQQSPHTTTQTSEAEAPTQTSDCTAIPVASHTNNSSSRHYQEHELRSAHYPHQTSESNSCSLDMSSTSNICLNNANNSTQPLQKELSPSRLQTQAQSSPSLHVSGAPESMDTLMGKAKQAISRLPDNPASAMCKSQLMKSIAESYPRTRQILRLEQVEQQIGDAISNWRSLHEREEGIELLQEARRFLGLAREAEQRNPIALLASRGSFTQTPNPPTNRRSTRLAKKGNGLPLPPGFPMSSSYPPTLAERGRERENERERVRERNSREQTGNQTATSGSQLPQTGTAVNRRSGQLRQIQPPAASSRKPANLTPGHRQGAASGAVGRVSGSDRVFDSSLPSSAVAGIPRAAVSIPGMDRSVVPATARQTAPSCRNGGTPPTGTARRRD